MFKRSIAFILLVVLVGGVLAACEPEPTKITANEAVKIAFENLGISEDEATAHVHEGTFKNEPCFQVYVTGEKIAKTYIIGINGGKILAITDGSAHSH